jgi:hypothetical protein
MRRYLVTILYREPTHEKHAGVRRLHPYRATYEVLASDEVRARGLAVDEFRSAARRSSSGWVRMVVAVECRAIDDGVICEVAPA